MSNLNHTNKSTNSSLNGGSPSNKSLNSLTTTTNNSTMPSQLLQQQQQQNTSTFARHWSQKKHESVISSQHIEKNNFLNKIRGGSDSGQFIYFDSTLITNSNNDNSFESSPASTSSSNSSPHLNNSIIPMLSGKLYANEIILEIQSKKVSGFTLYDVINWLKQLATTYQSITFRTVKSAKRDLFTNGQNDNSRLLLLPLELRTYLDERFQKGSIDYDLQQIIRENVYMRTVPCTTRSPRPGETHGQDYIFLTNEQFLEMEQNGDLLEYGVYNGHYYGTPKPPKEPKCTQNGTIIQPQSIMNTKRNNSLNDMNSAINMKQQTRPKSIESKCLDTVLTFGDLYFLLYLFINF